MTETARDIPAVSTLEQADALAEHIAANKATRVTLESLKDKVESVVYWRPSTAPQMTVAVLVLFNGFVLIGKSAFLDPVNFDEELGKTCAFDDALRRAWPLEVYRRLSVAMLEQHAERTTADGQDDQQEGHAPGDGGEAA
jgi:Phage protein (N4 Gp49/phage Sf6 gene 66) family